MNKRGAIEPKRAILARVFNSISNDTVPSVPDVSVDLGSSAEANEEQRVKRFLDELAALEVDCFIEQDEKSLRERLRSVVSGKIVLSWDSSALPYNAGSVLENESVVLGSDSREKQAQAEIGVTGCDAAIAETGSLVLVPGPGKPRTASLLPFVHIALVERSRLYGTMGDFFAGESAVIHTTPHVNIVTGPSRTADIELNLTLGVHGPGKVIVILGP